LTEDDLSADQRAALAQLAKSALIESAATEVVSIGRTLFKDGEPSDLKLQRRYRLYRRLEAALALPGSAWRRCIRRTANSEQIRHARRSYQAVFGRIASPHGGSQSGCCLGSRSLWSICSLGSLP